MGKTVCRFKTQFSAIGEHYHCPTGKKTEMRHSPHVDSNGRRTLVKDREIAIYDIIQSHKEECEIENIIRRAVEGDYSILQKRHGQFLDITGCPSSIAEAQQFIMDTKEEFEKLPKEIKAKFEFNPELYVAEMSNDTESWLEKTGLADKIKQQKIEEANAMITEQNFQKVMANLATGDSISNKGGVDNE